MTTTVNQRYIAVIGMFDGVHLGHRHLICQLSDEAHKRGLLTAAVTFARHPLTQVKPEAAPTMLTDVDERKRLLHQAGIDKVIVVDFNQQIRMMTARQFMKMIHHQHSVDAIMLGFNNRFGHDRPENIEAYQLIGVEEGIDVVQATELRVGDAPSSTVVRQHIAEGLVDRASELLGRPYRLKATVVKGKAIGRSIGFPTANLQPIVENAAIPGDGVYAVKVHIEGQSCPLPGMLNIGHRPTVDHSLSSETTIEVNIIGYEGNLYDSILTVEFIKRLRSEQTFPSLDALCRQLDADRAASLQLFRKCSSKPN